MSKTDNFFVYGTLKEGGHFAAEFDNVRIRSTVAKLEGYDLLDLGWFPGIVPGDGEVVGEVHEYGDLSFVFTRMDGIEGYDDEHKDDSLYLRKRVTVVTEDGEKIEANAYVFNRSVPINAEKVAGGVWDLEKHS